MIEHILILCTGNICRSPMVQALLQQRMQGAGRRITIRSAGLGALVGKPAEANITQLMRARGLDISGHQARQVTLEMLRWADLILVMEQGQKQAVQDMDPTARGKTFLLGHWTGEEVPDPYRQDLTIHAQVLALADRLLEPWLVKLCSAI